MQMQKKICPLFFNFSILITFCLSFLSFFIDSLSSGDDEDYDEDPEDAGNENGEFLLIFFDYI